MYKKLSIMVLFIKMYKNVQQILEIWMYVHMYMCVCVCLSLLELFFYDISEWKWSL
jgi:hypothetical protein